jgi:hypothetical protein
MVHATRYPEWDDEDIIPEALVAQLYRIGEDAAVNLTVGLPPYRRALVAAYCYRRSHLHRLGLSIASTCDRSTLVRVLGVIPGTALFVQSRRLAYAPLSPGYRSKISLSKGLRRPAYLRLVVPEEAAEPPLGRSGDQ